MTMCWSVIEQVVGPSGPSLAVQNGATRRFVPMNVADIFVLSEAWGRYRYANTVRSSYCNTYSTKKNPYAQVGRIVSYFRKDQVLYKQNGPNGEQHLTKI